MKTFDIKDVFSWSNAEDAKQYIGKECYFADSIFRLQDNINNNKVYILEKVANNDKTDVTSLFIFYGSVSEFGWRLCLPAEKVTEIKEKKYRPFKSIDEFMNHLDLKCLMNNYIKVEDINTSEIYELMIVGAFVNGLVLPLYGALTMDQLFRKSKLKFNDQFLPFGVLDES